MAIGKDSRPPSDSCIGPSAESWHTSAGFVARCSKIMYQAAVRSCPQIDSG